MKILVIGDSHGNARFLKTVLSQAHDFDQKFEVVVQVGDFGIWPGWEGEQFLDSVSAMTRRFETKFYFIPGNHEDYDRLDELEAQFPDETFIQIRDELFYIPRGATWEWDGVKFGGLGGAISVDQAWRKKQEAETGQRIWWPQESVSGAHVTRLGTHRLDVLFTHDVPAGAEPVGHYKMRPDIDALTLPSKTLVAEACRNTNPTYALHGHWHQWNYQQWGPDTYPTQVIGLDADVNCEKLTDYLWAWGIYDTSDKVFKAGWQIHNEGMFR